MAQKCNFVHDLANNDDCVNYNNCYCNVVVAAVAAAEDDDDDDDDDDDNNERGIPLYTLTVCNQNSERLSKTSQALHGLSAIAELLVIMNDNNTQSGRVQPSVRL